MKLKQERLFELMNEIDDDLILRAEKSGVQRGRGRRIWLRVGALAACVCLIVGAVLTIPLLSGNQTFANLPDWEDALYSADMIGKLFDAQYLNSASTNAYKKVYVPNSGDLYIDALPNEEYLSVYRYHEPAVAIDEEEFEAFLDSIFPTLSDSLGVQFPPYEMKRPLPSAGVEVLQSVNNYTVLASQTESASSFALVGLTTGSSRIVLDGEAIQIDQRQSDAEVIASLDSVKAKLFHIFGTSFEDVKVERAYGKGFEYGVSSITVYYYNETAHPLNAMNGMPVSDHIEIRFENVSNSKSILGAAKIYYIKHRADASETYRVAASAKMISLADAEMLLYNGYVFGGHSCPICMKQQEKVSFEGYDFVDLEYVFAVDRKNSDFGFPFYAFYQQIGRDTNGNLIYAKTYVPAIEVKGYAEYFQSQERNHTAG